MSNLVTTDLDGNVLEGEFDPGREYSDCTLIRDENRKFIGGPMPPEN